MWARTLRPARSQTTRAAGRFSRKYNGQSQGGHTTYFQPPPEPPRPRRRILRSFILGTTCLGLGAYAHSWYDENPFHGAELTIQETMRDPQGFASVIASLAQDTATRMVPSMDMELAQDHLALRAAYTITPKTIGHSCQFASNFPCEDVEHSGTFNHFNDFNRDWPFWSIYDGHAGPRTAQLLKEILANIVGGYLMDEGCMDRPYVPNDPHVVQALKNAFNYVDAGLIEGGLEMVKADKGDFSLKLSVLANALSGSCALMALFDPAQSILRVANTGDSRAVLGRWDSDQGKYVVMPMSHDQTGFNADEVERLKRDHPGEEPIDPKTGRVHGIAVSRAFGDSRWKWSNEDSQLVHEKFWGPAPRPNGVIKTPPYLTAEPEVLETRVQGGKHPDFLIMASDGLWDNISSEDAVTCVEQWLQRFEPKKFLEQRSALTTMKEMLKGGSLKDMKTSYTKLADMTEEEDTYYDETERCMKWRVSPKHFVFEDDNCGVHLSKCGLKHVNFQQHGPVNLGAVKNALGGKRRNLFCGIVTMQPPLSRNVRDDITVQVIFFGQDPQQPITN